MSAQPVVNLNELELDALTELVNLGVSQAAVGLRDMVQDEVVLSVPKALIMTRDQAIDNLGQTSTSRLVAVHQNFDGAINGRAVLIFPEAQSMELVRAMVGGDLSLQDLMDLEQEALTETGNVLLNACLSTIANSLQRTLRISLSEVVHGDGSNFFNFAAVPNVADTVLFIYIKFIVSQRDIVGYLAMLLDLPSLISLKGLLADFLDRVGITSATTQAEVGIAR